MQPNFNAGVIQRLRRSLNFVSTAMLVVLAASAAVGTELPRYKFEVGQEIGYRSESTFKFGTGEKAGTFVDTIDYTVWVVQKNDNATWRLVVRKVTSSKRLDPEGKERVDPSKQQNAYCDIAADGSFALNDSLRGLVDISWLFPRLPPEPNERAWSAGYEWDQTELQYQLLEEQPAGMLRFREKRRTLLDPVYQFKWDTVYNFGRQEGLLVNAEQSFHQGIGFVGEGTEKWALADVKRRESEWAEKFAEDSRRCFAAKPGVIEMLQRIGKRPTVADAEISKAKEAIEKALARCTTAKGRAMCEQTLASWNDDADYFRDKATEWSKLIDKPSPDWRATDWEGKEYSLADYRGKVVVLDFWYRGCGWCIRAMPQIGQLHEDFQGQPVAIFGVNTDEDESDARFVMDYMKIKYSTLKNEGINEKYGVSGYPTLVVIDSEGVIRRFHSGYSPTLRDELAAEIKGLLVEARKQK